MRQYRTHLKLDHNTERKEKKLKTKNKNKTKLTLTRRLKSFPWDALVHGSIMAFYLNLEKLGKPERCVML